MAFCGAVLQVLGACGELGKGLNEGQRGPRGGSWRDLWGLGGVLWAGEKGRDSESSAGRGLGRVWEVSWGGSWRGLWGLGSVLGILGRVLGGVLKDLGTIVTLYRECTKTIGFSLVFMISERPKRVLRGSWGWSWGL